MDQEARTDVSFGRVLADTRRKLGISQRELADRIKKENGESISPQYLNDLERDRRNPPSAFLLAEFAAALGLPVEYLDYIAGQLPAALRGLDAKPDQVEEAFKAFRRTLEIRR